MKWESALSFPKLVITTLFVVFVVQLTLIENTVDGLRCFACEKQTDRFDICQTKDLLLASTNSKLSVECESNLKFCYTELEGPSEDAKVTRRGCTTGTIAATQDLFVCQTDNCNSHNYDELRPASKNASSGVTASYDMRGMSDPDNHTPSSCQSCRGLGECTNSMLQLLPPQIDRCNEDHLFCVATFVNFTSKNTTEMVFKGCVGYQPEFFAPDTYLCRTDNCNNWKTWKEADSASKVNKGGVINGASAEKSFMRR